MVKENILAKLTAKDDKYACAFAEQIISESQESDGWYEYFDDFASLLDYPKSLVRNRVMNILAANYACTIFYEMQQADMASQLLKWFENHIDELNESLHELSNRVT